MSHFITKCSECGTTITQCRCPDPNKTVQYEICDSCKDKPKTASIEAVKDGQESETKKELIGILEMIPPEFRVRVREGAGDENLFASLAVSVAKLVIKAQQK